MLGSAEFIIDLSLRAVNGPPFAAAGDIDAIRIQWVRIARRKTTNRLLAEQQTQTSCHLPHTSVPAEPVGAPIGLIGFKIVDGRGVGIEIGSQHAVFF